MTDEELDRDWKPNGRRPQSTIARSFSQELMDIFRIENSIADLDEQVDKRKQQINTQTSELEAIEARLREMEQRLRSQHPVLNNTGNNSNTMDQRLASAVGTGSPRSPRSPRPPVAGAFDHQSSPEDRRQQQQPRDAQEANGEDVPPPPPAKDYVARRAAAEAKSRSAGRGGVARPSQQAVPGALPPTPVASEDGDGEQDA
ncbi:hypothetical protein VTK73DRAFT_6771 [Phialemonium thermophilum]|uniref:Uncharacterized protein n=1 Tax=Phialemonium thermophilum TaxID=223376 RepID=A0ABR3WHR0_9PEZI